MAEADEVDLTAIGRDPAALEAFYREHVEAVLRFVGRRVDDPHLAADLTADVFLAAIDSAHTYRPRHGSPTGWLFGVARNTVEAHRRRAARELRAGNRLAGRRHVGADDLAALDERLDAEAQARTLYREMNRLSDGERAIRELVALDGLSLAEAARVLRITQVTARVRLHRARRKLRPHLGSSAVSDLLEVS